MTPRTVEVLLDDARRGRERVRRYADPIAIVRASEARLVGPALHILENARRAGMHVAGYFSYELGYVLETRLRSLLPEHPDVPLLWFGIFDTCEELTGESADAVLAARVTGRGYGGPLSHEWKFDAYEAQFKRVHELIQAGEIYQANLSLRSRFATVGDPMTLYLALRKRSKAAYGAFIDDGARHILSLSPELFFAVSREGEIVAKPMKGTAPRGSNPMDDMIARTLLQASPKDRAENLMIVDLLRNDLGRVAETGSVSVTDLYSVETYPTVHQMTSTVQARLKPNITVESLVRALFPCGSVTGTPKIRAMEVIHKLERSPRGIYCGAIGHFAPDGSAEFNVAIRTLTIGEGRGELGIGGAVVHDSRAASEYDECLLKARYYDTARKPLELIETLRFSPLDGFVRLEFHLERMARSAATFSIPFNRDDAVVAMRNAVSASATGQRVRLVLAEDGSFSCTAASLPPSPTMPWRYAISAVEMQSSDALLRHKTNWREAYEYELAHAQDCDEILFTNEHGRLTEGTRTNIFLKMGGQFLTPPLSDGVLGGCLRQALIADGKCKEAELYPSDLRACDEVLLGNSLRGLIRAVPVESLAVCTP